MGDEVKKISFGFSKFVKKTSIISNKLNQVKPDENKVEFIDCLESKSIKLKDPIACDDSVLVIPLKRQTGEMSKVTQDSNIVQTTDPTLNSQEDQTSIASGKGKIVSSVTSASILNSTSPTCENLTLDEIAAREILEDLNKKNVKEEMRIFSVPLTSNAPTGEKESSLEDYESIPVNAFGMAMLRGMGWAPGKGIGKNEQLVTPSVPTLRPKGMGLGADKVIKPIEDNINNDLKMSKGSFIRVLAGPHKDLYGHIEGFDEESGRLIVQLALQKISVSLNEFMIQLVDKKDYLRNSKVINASKYEQYKDEGKNNLNEISARELSNDNELRKESIYKTQSSTASESEQTDGQNTKPAKIKAVPLARDKSFKEQSRSRERSVENYKRNRYSRSPSESSVSRSRSTISTKNLEKRDFPDKLLRRIKRRSSTSPGGSNSSYDYSKSSISKTRNKKSHKNRSEKRLSPRSSDGEHSSSDYSRSKKHIKKRKHSSNKLKSRSRSRSPRKHSKHKKHKKSK